MSHPTFQPTISSIISCVESDGKMVQVDDRITSRIISHVYLMNKT